MKSKLTLVVIVVISVALAGIVFASRMQSARQLSSSLPTENANAGIPTSVLYDRMFRMIGSIRANATIQRLKGERITSMKTYFKDEAKLTDEENTALEKTALDFIVEVQEFDDQAAAIISQIRQTFTDGDVPAGQQVPAPPEELVALQARRDALALRYRDRLSAELGEKKFQDLDKFVHGDFASNFQTVPLSSVPQGLREERK